MTPESSGRSPAARAAILAAGAVAFAGSLFGAFLLGRATREEPPPPRTKTVPVEATQEELEKEPGTGLPVVDPPPPPPTPPPTQPPSPPFQAKVLAADSKMNIYLVSVGKDVGLRVGDVLVVSRGEAFVATVVVDKVFKDKASVVRGREDGTPGPDQVIRQGDRVRRAD